MCEANNVRWILEEPEYPNEKVANLPELLRRLPEPLNVELPKDFSSNPNGKVYNLLKLHTLRNEYTHFPSIHHSIEVSDAEAVIGEAIELIHSIVSRSDWQRWNRFFDTDVMDRLDRIKKVLSGLAQARAGRHADSARP